jgi:protein-arginine kinase
VIDPARFGYVSSDPKNIGTSLRASVIIKLKMLCQVDEFDELISYLHLECFTDTLAGCVPATLHCV